MCNVWTPRKRTLHCCFSWERKACNQFHLPTKSSIKMSSSLPRSCCCCWFFWRYTAKTTAQSFFCVCMMLYIIAYEVCVLLYIRCIWVSVMCTWGHLDPFAIIQFLESLLVKLGWCSWPFNKDICWHFSQCFQSYQTPKLSLSSF